MALLRDVLWRRGSEPSLEHSRLLSSSEGFMLAGRLITQVDRAPAEVHYAVHCGRDWRTRRAHVRVVRGLSSHGVDVRVDDEQHWWANGQRVPDLDGLIDIDLAFTPATNTLPIRRLALEVGESGAADAAWLRFPELTWERLPQRYSRVGERQYRYESGGGAFEADLDVDEEGVVVRYGDLWQRVEA